MGYPLELFVANSEPFFEAVGKRTEARHRCVLCKRFMLRVASILAGKTGALAIATGDNLGQVASQTLVNMAVISEATTVPILRPLVSYDKAEIVELGRRIGTFDQTHGELCCRAVPRYPATAAALETVRRLEESIEAVDLAKDAARDPERLVAKNGEFEAIS
jgi:thiamine biosynthesis protein ThiI